MSVDPGRQRGAGGGGDFTKFLVDSGPAAEYPRPAGPAVRRPRQVYRILPGRFCFRERPTRGKRPGPAGLALHTQGVTVVMSSFRTREEPDAVVVTIDPTK